MANFENLQQTITTAVYQNSDGDITGEALQLVLLTMLETMGRQSGFMGVATAETIPTELPDGKQFYVATEGGDYSAFGESYSALEDGLHLFYYDDENEEWAYADLLVNVSSAISGKQDALTEGDAVEITENNVLNVLYDNLTIMLGEDNKLYVVVNGEVADGNSGLVTGGVVYTYIDGQLGVANGIATLDENGTIPESQLPDDVVLEGEGTIIDDPELVDIYTRIVQEASAAVTSMEQARDAMVALTDEINNAIVDANSATSAANTAAQTVTPLISTAQNLLLQMQTAIVACNNATNNAVTMANTIQNQLANIQTAITNTQIAINYSNAQTAACATATNAANTAANDANSIIAATENAKDLCEEVTEEARAVVLQFDSLYDDLDERLAYIEENGVFSEGGTVVTI